MGVKEPINGQPISSLLPYSSQTSLKAGYAASGVSAHITGYIPFSILKTEPPRRKGQRPHAIVDRPYSLLPALTQGWAPQAKTRNFIDVPFSGFLAPPSELVD
jgi:hypothetical protein